MTEETPIDDIENWKFPVQYLNKLEELDPNTPYFNIVQGRLYEGMRQDARYSPSDALDVATALNVGDRETAFDIVYDELDGEELEERHDL